MKHLFVYWWFSSGIMRILLKVSEPILFWTTLLRHPAQFLHVTVPFLLVNLNLFILPLSVHVQFAIKCAIYVAILWDQYNICWSIDTRAQMANHQCSVWLSITLSFIEWRVAAGQVCKQDEQLSQRKRREGEMNEWMDGWCCALAVQIKKVGRVWVGYYGEKMEEHNYVWYCYKQVHVLCCLAAFPDTHTHIQKVANYTIIEQHSASITVTVITDQSNYTIGRFL